MKLIAIPQWQARYFSEGSAPDREIGPFQPLKNRAQPSNTINALRAHRVAQSHAAAVINDGFRYRQAGRCAWWPVSPDPVSTAAWLN